MKLRVRLRLSLYSIFREEMDAAIQRGWNRAHKYVEVPTPEQVCEGILQAVMGSLCDMIDFNTDDDPSFVSEKDYPPTGA